MPWGPGRATRFFMEQSFFTQTAEPLIAFNALGFERDGFSLFENVCGSLGSGEILQVAGGNGCGKTTLLKILTTALSPVKGELYWQGRALRQHRAEYLNDMVFVGHAPGIKANLTPRENLSWLACLSPSCKQNIQGALERVGLGAYLNTPCASLSAGQQRRVALSRLLISRATLWVLDEPLTAIDREGVELIERLFEEHLARGGAVIVSSHQELSLPGVNILNLAEYYSDD